MEILGLLSVYGLIILSIYNLVRAWMNKDKSCIWSPLTFITLVYIYYVIIVYFIGGTDHYNMRMPHLAEYSFIGAFVSYLGVHIAFYTNHSTVLFKSINKVFSNSNVTKLSILLFFIGVIGYSSFKGFSLNVFVDENAELWKKDGNFEFYFTSLLALCCTSCSLLLVFSKDKWLVGIVFFVTITLYIMCGFRYRLVILIISTCTFWHLMPPVKKINYKVLIPLAVFAYFFFGFMDGARQYGAGIKREAFLSYSLSDARGAAENEGVFSFSGYVMATYANREKVYLEPVWCALTLPIPRALYPWKPNADYIKNISTYEYGGAAFTYYAEAYMAFGWIGVFFYGFLVGWISKRVWLNYINNKDNINAVLFLALFNGFTYVIISRGYLAQALVTFVYFVMMPFWISRLLKKIVK
jgi:hypothetical protein